MDGKFYCYESECITKYHNFANICMYMVYVYAEYITNDTMNRLTISLFEKIELLKKKLLPTRERERAREA